MNKCFSASVIILLSNRTLIDFKRAVYAGSQFFYLFELGVSFIVINYICLGSMRIHTAFYFNYIIYFALLIFCCQNVAKRFYTH